MKLSVEVCLVRFRDWQMQKEKNVVQAFPFYKPLILFRYSVGDMPVFDLKKVTK